MALFLIFAAGTISCAVASDPVGGLAARTGVHIGPRGVPLDKVVQATDLVEAPDAMAVAAGFCPAEFPLCYYDGDCVAYSCRDGCSWSLGVTYMHGWNGHGADCSRDNAQVAPQTCPGNFPVCYSDGDCVISSCADGCMWRRNGNYISRSTPCRHPYGAIETPELKLSTGVSVFAMAAVTAALLTLAAAFMVRRRSAPQGHNEPLLVTDL